MDRYSNLWIWAFEIKGMRGHSKRSEEREFEELTGMTVEEYLA